MAEKVLTLEDGRIKRITLGSTGENFSYRFIQVGVEVTVPEHQQMIVVDGITIEGDLILEGEICLL